MEKTLTFGDFEADRKQAFTKLALERHEAIQRELEGYVMAKLLEAEAKRVDQTVDGYLEQLAKEIPADEVQKFYDEHVKGDGGGVPLAEVEGRIREVLSTRKGAEHVKKASSVKLTLPEPEVAVTKFDLADHPMRGSPTAPVTIVAFSDFQCPYCAEATKPMEELLKVFPEQVRVYFLHFPLDVHPQAMPAALASRCAQQQGKFWEMHDRIFQNQDTLSAEALKGHATALGLDLKKYEACVADPTTESFVRADLKQGNEAGVRGTPSFYVNGKLTAGPLPSVAQIRALLEG